MKFEESDILNFLFRYHAIIRKAEQAGAVDGSAAPAVTARMEAELALLAIECREINSYVGVFRRLEDGHSGSA